MASSRDSGSSTLYTTDSLSGSVDRKPHSALVKASILSNIRPPTSGDAFKDIKEILEILYEHDVPGPRLLRMSREFSEKVGAGAQGTVHVPCPAYDDLLALCSTSKEVKDETVRYAAHTWRLCAVKQLRDGKGRDKQVSSALSEVRRLCHPRLKASRYIVSLVGWGLCLDSLEKPALGSPRLPLLIFEKATCDLSVFIHDGHGKEYKTLDYNALCDIALDIGRGLQSIHRASICHGDLKLDNVLVFAPMSDSPGGPSRATPRWHAKICDFGSAHETDAKVSIKRYLGTKTWKPPETFGPSRLVNLQLCDIFTYGLVAWALFTGKSSSPIESVNADQFAETWGQQQSYYSALEDVVMIHPGPTTVADAEAGLITSAPRMQGPETRALIHDTPHHMRDMMGFLWSATTRANHRSSRPVAKSNGGVPVGGSRSLHDFGPCANRLLAVLAGALNDDPDLRHQQPWQFLNRDLYPTITRVQTLRFLPKERRRAKRQVPDSSADRAFEWYGSLGVHSKKIAQDIQDEIYESSRRLFFYLKLRFPVLQPGSLRQRIFETAHSIFSDILGHNPDDFSIVDHGSDVECFQLDISSKKDLVKFCDKYGLSLGLSNRALYGNPSFDHVLYALARLRSRFKPCCWGRVDLAGVIESHLRLVERRGCDETLAWALKNKTADDFVAGEAEELFKFIQPDYLNPPTMPSSQRSTIDDALTFRLLVLLDRNFFLGQNCAYRDGKLSLFEAYLRKLRRNEAALKVCQHFRRIASLDEATAESKLFYTGSLAGNTTSAIDQLDSQQVQTTALHDAVRAGNYPVVQYLLQTGFVVTAKDDSSYTAMDLAIKLAEAREHREGREILDLLSQHPSNKKLELDLPLGWESFVVSKDVQAFRETSVANEVDPITFQRPRLSLLQDRMLALAERKIDAENDQIFRLNPIRFLQKSKIQEVSLKPATEEILSDDWYRRDVFMTRNPEVKATSDERLWFRTLAKVVESLTKVAANVLNFTSLRFFLIFIPLSILSRIIPWSPNLQLAFSVLAIGPLLPCLASNFAHFCEALTTTGDAKHLAALTACTADAMIGSWAIIDGDVRLPLAIMFGSLLSNNLLVLGTSMVLGGWTSKEQLFHPTRDNTYLALSTVGPISCIMLYTFYHTRFEIDPHRTSQGVLFLSRAIAVLACIFSLFHANYRLSTHSHLFRDEDEDQGFWDKISELEIFPWPPLSSTSRSGTSWETSTGRTVVRQLPAQQRLLTGRFFHASAAEHHHSPLSTLISPIRGSPTNTDIVSCVLCIALLGTTTETFYNSIRGASQVRKTLVAMFVVPLAAKFWISWHPLHQAYRNKMDSAVEWTLGSNRHISLIVAPIWVIIGWVVAAPMTLRLDLMPTAIYGISTWLIITVLRSGRCNYLTGLGLVGTYILFTIALMI